MGECDQSVMKNAAMLLFLSKNGPNVSEEEYDFNGSKIKGTYTNDAPCRALLDKAKANGRRITTILCITSYDIHEKKIGDGETQLTRFKREIRKYAREKHEYEPEVIPIFYDFHLIKNADGEETAVQTRHTSNDNAIRIYKQIYDVLSRPEILNGSVKDGLEVYIDFTGGMRDVGLLITTIIRYLEFNNIHCREIFYSERDIQRTPPIREIHDIKDIYDTSKMIDGVNEFITTGSVQTLRTFFNSDESNDKEDLLTNVMASLNRFSEAIRICDLATIGDAMIEIERSLDELERADETNMNIHAVMFKSLIPQIRSKMYLKKTSKQDGGDSASVQSGLTVADGTVEQVEPADTYPRLIQWATENLLLQQAVTLYVEKMPLVYLHRNADGSCSCDCWNWFSETMAGIMKADPSVMNSLNSNDKKRYAQIETARGKGEAEFFYEGAFLAVEYEYDAQNRNLLHDFCNAVNHILVYLNQCNRDVSPANVKQQITYQINHLQQNISYHDQLKNALERLKTCVDKWKNSQNGPAMPFTIAGKAVTSNLSDFLRNTATNATSYQRFFLYNENPPSRQDQTINKKIRTLRILRNQILAMRKDSQHTKEEEKNTTSLYYLLKYYLAVKLIRNRSDHASEKNKTDAEIEAENFLALEGLDEKDSITINMEAENVSSIILAGLKWTESATVIA